VYNLDIIMVLKNIGVKHVDKFSVLMLLKYNGLGNLMKVRKKKELMENV